jgi:hypothetical protein
MLLLLSSTVASSCYKYCTDGSTSPGKYEYPLLMLQTYWRSCHFWINLKPFSFHAVKTYTLALAQLSKLGNNLQGLIPCPLATQLWGQLTLRALWYITTNRSVPVVTSNQWSLLADRWTLAAACTLYQWCQPRLRLPPIVREDVLGGARKHFAGYVKLIYIYYFVINIYLIYFRCKL